jgi:IS30 family transposase
LKKTARITKGLPNFEGIKESEFYCEQYAVNKAVRRFRLSIVEDPSIALAVIEGDLFTIKPILYNRAKYVLVLVKRKTRYRWIVLLKDKTAIVVFTALKGLFKFLKNRYGRYLACF